MNIYIYIYYLHVYPITTTPKISQLQIFMARAPGWQSNDRTELQHGFSPAFQREKSPNPALKLIVILNNRDINRDFDIFCWEILVVQ